jgi:putative sigma-54 modulation protein
MRVRTEAIQFKADQKLVEYIDKKLQKMDNYFDRIIEAKVTLKLENSGQVKDKIAEIKMSVPGEMIIVKESSKTFEAAIDTSVDVLKRRLIKYKEKLRSQS